MLLHAEPYPHVTGQQSSSLLLFADSVHSLVMWICQPVVSSSWRQSIIFPVSTLAVSRWPKRSPGADNHLQSLSAFRLPCDGFRSWLMGRSISKSSHLAFQVILVSYWEPLICIRLTAFIFFSLLLKPLCCWVLILLAETASAGM